jgi:hypothetical protein
MGTNEYQQREGGSTFFRKLAVLVLLAGGATAAWMVLGPNQGLQEKTGPGLTGAAGTSAPVPGPTGTAGLPNRAAPTGPGAAELKVAGQAEGAASPAVPNPVPAAATAVDTPSPESTVESTAESTVQDQAPVKPRPRAGAEPAPATRGKPTLRVRAPAAAKAPPPPKAVKRVRRPQPAPAVTAPYAPRKRVIEEPAEELPRLNPGGAPIID